jgi:hypothetical protein
MGCPVRTRLEPVRRPASGFFGVSPRCHESWRLVAEGNGTRLFLDHSGFDLNDKQGREALERMGPGWRNQVLPRLAQLVSELPS